MTFTGPESEGLRRRWRTLALLIGLIASPFTAGGKPANPADGGESSGAAPAVAELFDVTDGVTFHEKTNQLELCAKPLGEGGVSLKLTNEQYRSGQ